VAADGFYRVETVEADDEFQSGWFWFAALGRWRIRQCEVAPSGERSTQVRPVTAPGQPSGTVTGITPAGALSPDTMITLYQATALPAGPGHPLATTHQRLPGRQPLSARVMTFAVYGCFRRGMAGVSW
jgi:hypothetical protein